MKPDLYTKVVLTVIAACLVVLASKELQIIPNANASGEDLVKVDIVKIGGARADSYAGELSVRCRQ